MIRSKIGLMGGFAVVVLTLAGMFVFGASSARAQAVTASVTPYGTNSFDCVASGLNVFVSYRWGWEAEIYDADGNLVYGQYVYGSPQPPTYPGGTVSVFSINTVITPNFQMDGYYTCVFESFGVGDTPYVAGLYATGNGTFPG